MTKKCIICKKEPNGCSNSSFHLFPKSDFMREKWIAALNIIKIPNYKTTYICNDHFENECFHDSDVLRCRKRLRSTAIPTNINLHQSDYDTMTEKSQINICKTEVSMENVPVSAFGEGSTESYVEDQTLTEKAILKVDIKVDTSTDNPNGNITNNLGNKKRKQSFPNSNSKKKIRFMDGFKTEYVTREDFVSDEAWYRFLRLMAYNRSKMSAAHNKTCRKGKRILKLKGLIQDLEQKQEFNAAKYLKDLPPHVQELLIRMKSRKATVPFPENLKTFAKTLHFYSPAAYEAVRHSFLNCLPCTQTLNSWISSKEYKPGMSKEINTVCNIVNQETENGKK